MKKQWAPPAVRWFLLLCIAAVFFWAIPFACERLSRHGLVWFVLSIYGMLPVCSAVLPYWGGKRGLHPMAGFFPLGCALLFSPHAHLPGLAFLYMGISLVACVAGNEVKKRREQSSGGKKK